jgi:hypothetical protein
MYINDEHLTNPNKTINYEKKQDIALENQQNYGMRL